MSLGESLGILAPETVDQVQLRRTLMDLCLESVNDGRLLPEDVPRQLAKLLRQASGVDLPDVPAVALHPVATEDSTVPPIEDHRVQTMLLDPRVELEG
jgi:hypothetical protein